jgi:hypothetical protein
MRAAGGKAVFRALVEADVRFLVVGGLAVNVHGFMRMTLDIDLVVNLEVGNIVRAFAALSSVGYRPTVPVSDAEFGDVKTRESWVRDRNMRVLRFHSDEHFDTPVDVFAAEPFSFDDEYDQATIRELAGVGGIRVVSLPTLLRIKEAAGRSLDIADIDGLRLRLNPMSERTDHERIDWSLTTWEGNRRAQMEHWASMSLERILQAQEEMAELSRDLARQAENVPAAKDRPGTLHVAEGRAN